MIKIEFFHDVICSFCFPMSARMRKISNKIKELEIIHRSFALGWQEMDFIRMFGSREAVKPEVLDHWVHANQNDEQHRFNIEGMREKDFVFPLSKPALLAAKAAGILGGEALYWEAFDRLQHKLFVENKNIEEMAVLEEAISEAGIRIEDWRKLFNDPQTEAQVKEDFLLATTYGVNSVPTLIINEKYKISGARSEAEIIHLLERIAQEENIRLDLSEEEACNFRDEKWECQ